MSSSGDVHSESALLIHVGDVMIAQVVQTCTFTLIYGIFCLLYSQWATTYLFVFCSQTLTSNTNGPVTVSKKKQPNKAQFWMFLLSTATFLLATLHEATLLAYTGIGIHSVLIGSQDLPLAERLQVANGLLSKPNAILGLVSYIESVTSDIVVIWRAFVLLGHQRWLMILPCVPLLSSIAIYIAFLVVSQMGNIRYMNGQLNTHRLDTIGVGLSLAANVMATALIGYVYWKHRRDMVAGLGRHRTTQAERVLALLLESGVIFCLLQAMVVIFPFTPAFHTSKIAFYAKDIFPTTSFAASAMYPTMVIVLVNNHRTMDYIYSTNMSLPTISEVEPGHITTLQFVQPLGVSSQESEKNDDTKTV